jgi:hypothetical protein
MAVFSADSFAQLLNSYTLSDGPPRQLSVPKLSQLAALREVTVSGTLIPKRLTHIQPDGSTRYQSIPHKTGGTYIVEDDGDIHFCLGTDPDAVHVPCELQHAADWKATFNGAVGKQVTVSGFFRCLFEHPGFDPREDAHIFEIHPVRAVDFGDGKGLSNVDVGRPDDKSIHRWLDPYDLNQTDRAMEVSYDAFGTATFSGFGQGDENYTEEPGQISSIDLTPGSPQPSTFVFTGDNILNPDNKTKRPLRAYCLKNTTAARQLETLADGDRVTLLSLRNIDLSAAMSNAYAISLLAIDIQPAGAPASSPAR